jgi:hypothetical protein
VRGK